MQEDTLITEFTDDPLLSESKGPGARLAKARSAAKLSQAQVANALHLTVRVIDDIENDDYSESIGSTYIRGYLRAYARLVGLPGDSIITAYNQLGIVDAESNFGTKTPYPIQPSLRDRSVRWGSYGIAVLLIALVFAWWNGQHQPTNTSLTAATTDIQSTRLMTVTNNEIETTVTTQSKQAKQTIVTPVRDVKNDNDSLKKTARKSLLINQHNSFNRKHA